MPVVIFAIDIFRCYALISYFSFISIIDIAIFAPMLSSDCLFDFRCFYTPFSLYHADIAAFAFSAAHAVFASR